MTRETNELDELIFDYLEGNFSPKEKEAFEILLADRPDWRDQLNSWRQVFVKEPLPETGKLEQEIIKKHSGGNWQFLIKSLLCLMLASVITASNFKGVNPKGSIASKESNATSIPATHNEAFEKAVSVSINSVPVKIVANKNEIAGIISSDDEGQGTYDENRIMKNSIPILSQEIYTVDFGPIEIQRIHTKKNEQSQYKHLSRTEVRALNKRKRKNEVNKAAIKFIKGRTPYVVPLDINNF